jgi:alkylation response protein AidB-like acyl-CoA dehydrogenase
MRPTLSPAQEHLGAVVADALGGAGTRDTAGVWAAMRDVGLLDLAVPESAGGVGLAQRDLCVAFEELGARLAPDAGVRAALLVVDAWTLGDAAEGDRMLAHLRAPAVVGASVIGAWEAKAATALPDAIAAHLTCVAGDGGSARFRLSSGPRGSCEETTVGQDALRRLAQRDRIRGAAWLVGLARRAQQLSARRVTARRVGGRRLVEHQAAAHRLARGALVIDAARLETWQAAWHDDEGEGAGFRARTALAMALEAATRAAREAVQLHGALGTSAPDVVGLYAAAHAAPTAWGAPDELWRTAARERYDAQQSR